MLSSEQSKPAFGTFGEENVKIALAELANAGGMLSI
jgi:hypothetical protein